MYMTTTHTRNIRYRNLHRAVPVAVKYETVATWERDTKAMVDVAYREFWRKRGKKAPWVSPFRVGLIEKVGEI